VLDTVRRISDQELILGQISYRNEMERGREKRGGRESGRDRERERERGEIEREREGDRNQYVYLCECFCKLCYPEGAGGSLRKHYLLFMFT
jgi:hypothetical protein